MGGGSGKDTNLLQSSNFKTAKARTFFSMAGQPDYRADDIYSGSASFHPYFVLEDPKIGDGVFFGFNYLGPWSTKVWNPGDNEKGGFPINSQLELHIEPLEPGASFEVPNSFVGIYKGDLDNAGEQLQDWQATFKWDYTREKYLYLASIVNRFWNDPATSRNRTCTRRSCGTSPSAAAAPARSPTRTISGSTSEGGAFGKASIGPSWSATFGSRASSSSCGCRRSTSPRERRKTWIILTGRWSRRCRAG